MSTHPHCSVIITGDFNNLDMSDVMTHHNLKQVVRDPTRGSNILDLIITNLSHLYSPPVITVPIGTSDHNTVEWNADANSVCLRSHGVTKRSVHRFTQSSCEAFGRWSSTHVWFTDVHRPVSALAASFTVVIVHINYIN